MLAVSFLLPATTSWFVVSWGATAATPASLPSAVASSMVSVVAEPNAPRVAPVLPAPALTVSRLVPSDSRFLLMPAVAPWPTATRATTEPTPMMMPSMVSSARIRDDARRDSASRTSSTVFI